LYLTIAEGNEPKRLKTMADEGSFGDEELFAAKGTRRFTFRYWGKDGMVEFGFKFGEFLSYSSP
jgi:hypothetical protein